MASHPGGSSAAATAAVPPMSLHATAPSRGVSHVIGGDADARDPFGDEPQVLYHQCFGGGRIVSPHGNAAGFITAFVDEHTVVCTAGQHTVLVNLAAKTTLFFDTHKNCAEALSVTVDPSSQLVAVCERVRVDSGPSGEGVALKAQVSVYSIKTRECLRTFTYKHASSGVTARTPAAGARRGSVSGLAADAGAPLPESFDFVQCGFSGDSTHIVAYGCSSNALSNATSEGVIVLFKWRSKKLIGTGRLPPGVQLTRVRINPHSHLRPDGSLAPVTSLHISACGPQYLRSWRPLGDGTLRETPLVHPKREQACFVDHVWLSSAPASAVAPGGKADSFAFSSTRKSKERRLACLLDDGSLYIIAKHDTDTNTLLELAGAEASGAARLGTPHGATLAGGSRDASVPTGGGDTLVHSGAATSGAAGATPAASGTSSSTEIWELRCVMKVAVPEQLLRSVLDGVAVDDEALDPIIARGATDRKRRTSTHAAAPMPASSVVPSASGAPASDKGPPVVTVEQLLDARSRMRFRAITATSKGFMVAGSHGCVIVYERSDSTNGARMRPRQLAPGVASAKIASVLGRTGAPGDPTSDMPFHQDSASADPFVPMRSIIVAANPTLRFINISPSEEAVLLFTSQMGPAHMLLNGADGSSDDSDVQLAAELQPLFGQGVHVKAITGLGLCVTQPRLVSCAQDKTIRVWNYVAPACEVAHPVSETAMVPTSSAMLRAGADTISLRATMRQGAFSLSGSDSAESEPLCLALHPSGTLLAVGFRERMILYNVCAASMLSWRTLQLKHVQAVAFSHGGAFLAVAAGFTVYVYMAHTTELVHTMSAHVGNVRQVVWAPDDSHVATTGDDGGVFLWSMRTGKRVEQLSNVLKTVRFTALVLVHTPDRNLQVGGLPAEPVMRAPSAFGGGMGGSLSSSIVPGNTVSSPAFTDKSRRGSANATNAAPAITAANAAPGTAAAVTSVSAIVAAGRGADGVSVIYCCSVPEGNIIKVRVNGTRVTRLAIDPSGRRLFAGTSLGSVRVYAWPLQYDASTMLRRGRAGLALAAPAPAPATATTALASTAVPAPGGGGGALGSTSKARRPHTLAVKGSVPRSNDARTPSKLHGGSAELVVGQADEQGDVTPSGAEDGGEEETYEELVTSSAGASSFGEPMHRELHLHSARVSGMRISHDGRYLFTAGEDGVLFVLGLPYPDTGRSASPRKLVRVPTLAAVRGGRPGTSDTAASGSDGEDGHAARGDDASGPLDLTSSYLQWVWEPTPLRMFNAAVTLIPRAVYEDAMARLAASESELKEARDDALRALARANSDFAAKLSSLNEVAERAILSERTRYEALAARHESYVRESVAAREKAEAEAARALAETENRYERRLAAEMQRYDELQEEVIAVKQAAEEALSKAEVERKEQVAALLSAAAKRQSDLENIIQKLRAGLRDAEERHNAILEDAENENEDYITKMKVSMEEAIADEGKRTQEKQAVVTKLTKNVSQLTKQVRAFDRELDAARTDVSAKEARIAQLQEQVRSLNRIIDEQSAALTDRERDMSLLRAEKRTLENFRFVLDHRLAELDAERAPVTEHVGKLEQHIRALYEEMVVKFHANKASDRELETLRDKLATLTSELKKARVTVAEKVRTIDNMQRDVERVARGPDTELRRGVTELIAKHVSEKAAPASGRPAATLARAMTPTAETATLSHSESMPAVGSRGMRASSSAATLRRPDAGRSGNAVVPGMVSLHEHTETVGELVRQREYMRRGAAALSRQVENVARAAGRKAASAVTDNMMLMDEANVLRQELVAQRRRITKLETRSGRDDVSPDIPASPDGGRRRMLAPAGLTADLTGGMSASAVPNPRLLSPLATASVASFALSETTVGGSTVSRDRALSGQSAMAPVIRGSRTGTDVIVTKPGTPVRP